MTWSCKIKNASEVVGQINLPALAMDRKPDHEAPVDLWSPLHGDEEYVIHSTGHQRFWYVEPGDLQAMVPKGYDKVMQEISHWQQVDHDHWWIVVEDIRKHERVAKTNQLFVEALNAYGR